MGKPVANPNGLLYSNWVLTEVMGLGGWAKMSGLVRYGDVECDDVFKSKVVK